MGGQQNLYRVGVLSLTSMPDPILLLGAEMKLGLGRSIPTWSVMPQAFARSAGIKTVKLFSMY
jgi:hypothetical protein